ncbi:hypothetical protein [Aureibacter tunicatorum]|uniref:Uncharacterized protein n=1 Tax=Aureibacter tunicatorum TaxID=866807 RepID=A0AAE4BUA3_9BACT|nr:hypothetical protein [Aureibacter tunicatorum]MDR6241586.1 hypothetical protein [Aureibacter tunicatorum]BDD07190.1 hypothetical protein AUTU_46730 [Aureibacter tunicatorum]
MIANKLYASVVLFVIAIVLGALALFKSSFAPGWDSYFYMLQAKSWLELRSLHSERYNVIYPLLICAQLIFDNYVFSYKLISILAYGTLPVLLYRYLTKLHFNKFLVFGVCLLVIANPISIYFASQFTKNLIAVNLFILLMDSVSRKRWFLALGFMILIAFSHKLMIALSIIYVGLYAFSYLPIREVYLRWLCLFMMTVSVFLLMKILAPSYLAKSWNIPTMSFIDSHVEMINGIWKLVLYAFTVLIPFCFLFPFKGDKNQMKQGFTLAMFFIFLQLPFLKWGTMELSFRLFMIFGLLSPILVLFIRLHDIAKTGLACVLILISFGSFPGYKSQLQDPPYIQYKFISSRLAKVYEEKEINLLICHKALAEYVSFHHMEDVLPWNVEGSEVNDNVYRLAYIPSELQVKFENVMINEFHKRITSNYFLLREKIWRDEFLASLDDAEKVIIQTWKNPWMIR